MTQYASEPIIPIHLAMRYTAWSWTAVSRYPPDSGTYRLTDPEGEVRFLKITGAGGYPSAAAEAERLRWAAAAGAPVPEVLEAGTDGGGSWLVTAGLEGMDATHPQLQSDPQNLVRLLARGLRDLHRVSWQGCPFSFRADDALRIARDRLARGRINPRRDFHPEHAHLSAAEAVAELERTRPATEDLVLCHGDYCLPNVVISRGRVGGFVDLGELGVADRWWDLAVATWSVTWNLGPGLEPLFVERYGIAPDLDRIRFYRLLYDVVSYAPGGIFATIANDTAPAKRPWGRTNRLRYAHGAPHPRRCADG